MESVSPPKERLVLDCSVALCWYFRDEADPYADGVATKLTSTEAVVPSLWPLEVANAVLMGERRKRSTQADAQRWITVLETLPITLDGETAARAWNDTLRLARAQNLSAYDAAYLELALREGLPLATLDAGLKAAAQAVGVPLFPVAS
ncbi:MAG TPA: type II toxin-antitoxin system VapC family toxin [Isosphaeraceae bacterium]|jgi:predicted nucleic acid-binding protein